VILQCLFTTKAKAEKIAAKGKPFDLEELIRMEADRGTISVIRPAG